MYQDLRANLNVIYEAPENSFTCDGAITLNGPNGDFAQSCAENACQNGDGTLHMESL